MCDVILGFRVAMIDCTAIVIFCTAIVVFRTAIVVFCTMNVVFCTANVWYCTAIDGFFPLEVFGGGKAVSVSVDEPCDGCIASFGLCFHDNG